MTSTNELVARVMRARDEHRLHDGVLLQMRTDVSIEAPWFAASETRNDLLGIFKKGEANAQISSDVLGRDDRIAFWAIGYQVHAVQYRFLIPLVGPTLNAVIEGANAVGLGLLMHSRGKETAVEAHVTVSPSMYATLKERHQAAPDLVEAIREQAATIAQMLDPDFLTRIPGLPRPKVVAVSSVLPQEMEPLFDEYATPGS